MKAKALSDAERQAIAKLICAGRTSKQVAAKCGRSTATVCAVARLYGLKIKKDYRSKSGRPWAPCDDPTPGEIREACAAIRATWSPQEERKRRAWDAQASRVMFHEFDTRQLA